MVVDVAEQSVETIFDEALQHPSPSYALGTRTARDSFARGGCAALARVSAVVGVVRLATVAAMGGAL
jgi:hypothetical protein